MVPPPATAPSPPARDPALLPRLPPTATEDERIAWSRKYLVQLGRYLEWDRVTSTPDEPFLPVALIQQLIDVKLWPPPIEPVDPFGYVYFPSSEIPTRRTLPQRVKMAPEEEAGFRTAYGQLRVEYEQRAPLFARAVQVASWPPAIVELADKFGSLPRRGSPALPVQVDSKKGGL